MDRTISREIRSIILKIIITQTFTIITAAFVFYITTEKRLTALDEKTQVLAAAVEKKADKEFCNQVNSNILSQINAVRDDLKEIRSILLQNQIKYSHDGIARNN